jgi:hypothetical protein
MYGGLANEQNYGIKNRYAYCALPNPAKLYYKLHNFQIKFYNPIKGLSLQTRRYRDMGLPLRITFNDKDYIYQIVNSNLINQNTTELELLVNGEKLQLIREKTVWIQKGGDQTLDPNFIQALGRSVSLRLRM